MIIDSFLQFEKLNQIGAGQGLNSTVWRARDKQLDCILVVKEIDKATFWNPNCFQEAQVVFAVDHPNVVRVQYASQDAAKAYVAMPYYAAGSLTDKLASGPLKLSAVLKMGQELLLGLGHIHSKDYVHLDLKPTNVLFDGLGRALIADFGQARILNSHGVVSAPPIYRRIMPPEILNSGNAAQVSDIYQMGLLLYRALNGEQWWQAQFAKYPTSNLLRTAILNGTFPDRKAFLPHVPKKLRKVIKRALELNPSSRFQSSSQLAAQLGKVTLRHDWMPTLTSSHEEDWRCTPAISAPLLIELRKTGSVWTSAAYTESNGTRRAKDRATLWKTFPSKVAAYKALHTMFESL